LAKETAGRYVAHFPLPKANNSRIHPIEKFVGNEVLQGAVHMATRCSMYWILDIS